MTARTASITNLRGGTPPYEQFRAELCRLLDGPEVSEVQAQITADDGDCDPRPLYRLLGARGWLAPDWPRRYGGIGGDPVHTGIVTEELARRHLPDSAHVNGIRNAGTFLLGAGTDAQRARLLPPLAAGQELMSVLYSEPEAGSDLAALTTTAKPCDGGWVLEGVKTYSVKTAAARFGLVAARTGEYPNKMFGITLFVVNLHTSGISVRALPTLNIEPFYEVTFDGARVGADDVVGEPDAGWFLLVEALAIERTGLDFNAKVCAWLETIRARAAANGRADDPLIQDRLAQLDADAAAGRALAWRMVRRQAAGELDPADAACAKWYNSELGQRVADLALLVDGPAGLLDDRSAGAPAARAFLREAPGLALSAGTSETMLAVIAAQLDLAGSNHD